MLWLPTVLLVVTTTTAATGAGEPSISENRSKELITNLRRQLMRDNSDYSLETSKKPEKLHTRAETEATLRETSYTHNYHVTASNDFSNNEQENVGITEHKDKTKSKAEHRISEKDLLYYIDDEKLNNKNNRRDDGGASGGTYKVLKVRHHYRRGGLHRYIQEEGEEGVAIVSVDRGPFPELRLPRSRRQYRHGRGEALPDDEEVPPPAVDSSDPEAAAEDVERSLAELTTDRLQTETAR